MWSLEKSMLRAPTLLTRDEFREKVFARDGNCCVICRSFGYRSPPGAALDAHHLIERRCWPDGGYYLENGATLCEVHHPLAESTELPCEEIRLKAGIDEILLPPHVSTDTRYDKWLNPFLANGQRLRGELFWDESVQKVLRPVLGQFTHWVKYPRTYHLPWSPGVGKDDRVLESMSWFDDIPLVATIKMDGENTTMYRDHIHARSVDSKNHPSRNLVRALWGNIAHDIPEGWRVCGENLYARHSIPYTDLSSYFQVFSVWNDRNICLSWDETKEWAELLGLQTVPLLWEGRCLLGSMLGGLTAKLPGWDPKKGVPDGVEGYVLRPREAFRYQDFHRRVGKFVRSGHVTTSSHWAQEQIVPNQLKDNPKEA